LAARLVIAAGEAIGEAHAGLAFSLHGCETSAAFTPSCIRARSKIAGMLARTILAYTVMMRRIWIRCFFLAGLSLLSVADMARADQKDPRLDDLFAQLKGAGTLQSRAIEQEIWTIWMTSDNDEVNKLMVEGVQAMQSDDYQTALADFTRM